MKNSVYLILALIFFALGCSNEKPNMEEPKDNTSTTTSKPQKPQGQNRIAPVSSLQRLEGFTRFSIDLIDGQKTKNTNAIILKSEKIQISGWAIDEKANNISGGVYVTLDGKNYPAVHNISRPDVAKFLGNPAYEKAGFKATIPLKGISKGTHQLGLKIITHSQKGFYEIPLKKRIPVQVK